MVKVDKAATKKAQERQEAGIERLRKAFGWSPPTGNVQHGGKR